MDREDKQMFLECLLLRNNQKTPLKTQAPLRKYLEPRKVYKGGKGVFEEEESVVEKEEKEVDKKLRPRWS